jgi:hypothetical protein
MFGIYTFTVDVSAGLQAATLTIEKVGEYTPPAFDATLDGVPMTMVDADNYKVEKDFVQGQVIAVEGIDDVLTWWFDPDYVNINYTTLTPTFAPISGKYRVTANIALKYFKIEAMDGDNLATLKDDGTGAIWVIGTNIGKPSVAANNVSWATEKGLCMAPIGDKKYQLTVTVGTTITDVAFKFFYQQGWGGEFVGAGYTGDDKDAKGVLTTTSDIIGIKDDGNLELKAVPAVGDTYVFTIDVSAGLKSAVLTVTKQ